MFKLAHPFEPSARAFGRLVTVFATLVAVCVIISRAGAPAFANTHEAPPIVVDGSNVTIRALERNNNVFVPVRGVFEKLGADVAYTSPGSIMVRKNGKELARMTVGNRTAIVNGGSHMLLVAPFAERGRVMVPLRFISEAAGATVAYVARPQSVQITHRTPIAAAAPAVEPLASAAPVAAAVPVAEQSHGFPWWLWLLIALALLVAILLMLRQRRKEPIIRTSAGRSDPTIETRH